MYFYLYTYKYLSKWQSHYRALPLGKSDSRAGGSAGGVPGKWVCQGFCKDLVPNLSLKFRQDGARQAK